MFQYKKGNRKQMLSSLTDMRYLWDTQNHLLAAASNGYVSTYIYDGEGKRTVKQHGGNEAVYTNSAEAGVRTEAPHYSLYANPYFVMTDGDKYTEHIYIGSERIAVRVAKLSDESSVLGNFDEEEMAGQDIVVGGIDYGVKREAQEQVIEDCYDSLQYAYLLVDRRDLVNIGMVPSDADTSDVDDSDDERGTANPDTEWKKVYYYCTDHLGSTRLVLDSNGQIAEKLMFLPTGEVFMDEQNSTLYHSDFLFSGKELDAETGNYYFGARYLAPRLGIWLSPDPMQLKYPHISSYAYCMGNPVKLIDPTGKDYHVYIDDRSKTIRVYAYYYTATEDLASAQKAVDFWNGQSGKFKYKDYTVKFDLHVKEVKEDLGYNKIEYLKNLVEADNSKAANSYALDFNYEKKDNLNGRTNNGRFIGIRPSRSNADTGAHEVGHTLGLEHQLSGIMTAGETDPTRSSKINKNTIKTIVKQSSNKRNPNSNAGVGTSYNITNDN